MEPQLILIEKFVSESQELFKLLRNSVVWDERMKARKTASFGVSYNYSGIAYPETAMPEALQAICFRINEDIGFLPNNCLMNYYLDGDSSMGYHSDSAEELAPGSGVVIVSLGAERHIHYKLKSNKEVVCTYKLDSGTLLFMDNEVQKSWLHAIPKEKDVGERISLTFRNIVK